jgi:signal transduction histidine kinase
LGRLTSGQWLGVTAGVLVVAALVGLGICLVALHRLADARGQVVDRVDPAVARSGRYLSALVGQETGVRGYVLSGRRELLDPFDVGARDANAAAARLRELGRDIPLLDSDVTNVGAQAVAWRLLYAEPAILAVRRGGPRAQGVPSVREGQRLFDQVRAAAARMDRNLARARASGRARLRSAARAATVAVLFAGALLLAAAFVASATLQRVVTAPLARLARGSRRVARGEFGRAVAIEGPRDIVGLSTDVDSMRRRILAELDAVDGARRRLEQQTLDLQRSNAELEQFAYVASHDLQEPLRRVASFCGMLQHRYAGQLDERADQYIGFAVDGAERMQELINDLLEFSRVGRGEVEHVALGMDDVLAAATHDLGETIEQAGATVVVDGPLPEVRGDRSLLVALVRNLIGNAVKFRGEDAPRVRVSAAPDGEGLWRFAVDDNGIGVSPQYADRIFVIFQRLHTREEYDGTGIGLAMARKIVEFHGGRIWVEPEGADGGASFRFTLPAP